MPQLLRDMLDWSEVWALLIPLTFMLIFRSSSGYLKPIRIYIIIFLLLNIVIDLKANLGDKLNIQDGDLLYNNNFIYHIESILRLLLFAWFFILLRQPFLVTIKKLIPFIFIGFVLVNFIFFEKFVPQHEEALSSRLLGTEAALMLFYCLQYFIYLIREDKITMVKSQPGFWVLVGLTIYVAASFFVYLFYDYLVHHYNEFAVSIWDVHNVTFIVFCVFIAIQFYQEHKQQQR